MNKNFISENKDTYLTLTSRSESLFKDKGSKHFGYAFPVYSLEEVKEKLEIIRKEHHQARHHCYAYRLGLDKKTFRANDDGEPSNSAGPPILGQIQSYDLTNVLIIVVRYFGGTKLGVGGLINAYKTASKLAIEENKIIEKKVHHFYKIEFKYESMGSIMKFLKDHNLPQSEQNFDLQCSLNTQIRSSEKDVIENFFGDKEYVKLTLLNIA